MAKVKVKNEAPTLAKLAKDVAPRGYNIRVGKAVSFDHVDIQQVAVKCINPKTNTQVYFNAYKKDAEDFWFCGAASNSAVKDVDKAQKGLSDLSAFE